MGYYADTSWDVKFHSKTARTTCEEELTAEFGEPYGGSILSYVGENADENDIGVIDDLELYGWTTGKYSWEADKVYQIIARYADGAVEVDASDSGDGHWKIVLKDGEVKHHAGRIVYDDALEPFKESAKALQAAVDADDWTATDDLFAAMQDNALETMRELTGMN